MRIYGRNELDKLIVERDIYRKKYVERFDEISYNYNIRILEAKRDVKKLSLYCDLAIVGIILYYLITYKDIENKVLLGLLIVMIIGFGYLLYLYIKKIRYHEKLEAEFNKENEENNEFGKKIVEANYKVAKCAIAIICYSENYLLLESLDEKEKIKKFNELFTLYVRAIDKEHGNKATVDDYINYYYNWERKFL